MKKVFLILGAVSMLTLASCRKEEKEVTTTDISTNDTIVVQNEDPAPPPPPAPEAPAEDPDGTSVSINSDGINVDSKSGDKKTTVKVDGENSSVDVKR